MAPNKNNNPDGFPAEERVLSLAGVTLRLQATATDTNGQWSLVEYSAPPQFAGPAPHWHKRTFEAFYVIDGILTARLGEQTIEVPAGEIILIPPRTVHSFSNTKYDPVKFLVLLSPGGMEGYFVELVDLIKNEPAWPPTDMSTVIALAERYDTFAPPVTP